MAAIITNNFKFLQATQFRESFSAGSPNRVYLGIGRPSPWANELSPNTPSDSSASDVADRRDLMAIKRVNIADTCLCVPRVDWNYGTVYTSYDDAGVLTGTNFYVLTDEYKLYKCISRPSAITQSTSKPTATPSSGFVTTADGYKWKYMLTIPATDTFRFMTNLWIPLRELTADDSSGSNQWAVQNAATPGTIDGAVVVTGGTGYSSAPTVTVVGDGTGATATATILGGAVTSVTVTGGTGYTFATLVFSGGGGTGASARAILSPINGHGSSAVRELGATYVMVNAVLSYDESGKFPQKNDYRKIILLMNPKLNGSSVLASDPVHSCVQKITVSAITGTFAVDETVRGQTSNATGVVVEVSGNTISYVNLNGSFAVGENVTGLLSGAVGNSITSKTSSEIDSNSGVIIYKDYRRYVGRDPSQAENIIIVTEF